MRAHITGLKQKTGWESFLSDDMTFTSFTSPIGRIAGRAAFLESTKRFYAMTTTVEVRDLMIDRDKREPQPDTSSSRLRACLREQCRRSFRVQDGKVKSFDIYFDTSPYPK